MPNNITRTVGRPRAVIKLPRKARFTVLDVYDINFYSELTIRNSINRLLHLGRLVCAGTVKSKAGKRGRPCYVFAHARNAAR